jgi:antirestriction protein ArdC
MQNQYQTVTDRIVTMLEAGTRPWCKPWQDGASVTVGGLQRPLRVTSYIASWIRVLKNDNRAIFKAATLAEAAARYLHAQQSAEALAIAA